MKALLFVYGLTAFGAIASLVSPFWAVWVYVFLAILRPEHTWQFTVPAGFYSRIVGIAILLGWLVHGFGAWNLGKAKWPLIAFTCYFAWCLISYSVVSPDSIASAQYVLIIAKIYLPFVSGLTLLSCRRQLLALPWAIILPAGYIAYLENDRYYSIGYLAEGDNILAHSMACSLFVALWTAVYVTSYWRKAVAFGCAGLMLHAVMIHMSRGAMIGIVAGGAITLAMLPRSRHAIGIAISTLVLTFSLAGPSVVDEFATVFSGSDVQDSEDREVYESRWDFWRAMATQIARTPVLGVGPREWPQVAARYGFPNREGHNLWLQSAAETGIPGGLLHGGIFALCIGGAIALYCRYGASPSYPLSDGRYFAGMTASALSAFMTEQLVGSFFTMEHPYYIALCWAGYLKLKSGSVTPSGLIGESRALAPIAGDFHDRSGDGAAGKVKPALI